MYHMYPRGRKVCFATAGFLLIAKTRVYLRSCGIPTGKKRAGLACGIGNILRAGRPSGGQPSFPGRLAGRREAAAKRGTGNAPWRRRKEGRRGGRRCFAGPAGRQNQSRGGGRRPPPLLWLSKKWLAPLFRGVHSSLAPTARPGSYARKPLLRKAFCGFDAHPPGGLLLSLRDNSPCVAKSDESLRGLRPPNPRGFFDRLSRGRGRRPRPCFVRAVRARRPGRGWEEPGPALNGPGRRKTLVGRGGAGRDALGKAAAHDLRAAAA